MCNFGRFPCATKVGSAAMTALKQNEVGICRTLVTSELEKLLAPLFSDMDAGYGGGLLDMVKGGAGKFFSNFKDNLKDTLKDTSTKVMHQVAT